MTNTVTLIGNKSLEVDIYNEGENPFAVLSLAENKRYRDEQGNWQTVDRATFHDILLFDDKLIKQANNLKVGALIKVTGSVIYQKKQFFKEDGSPVSVNQMSIKAHKVEMGTFSTSKALNKHQDKEAANA
ncbi:single-stranded DNA-binding protein [Ekhidna sp.]|jgi:single-stranded DNA-binding protein|uniref:single-stranded DNA-binding protein n=1 Tax=Ekhidna sp. TaxID=2608089 RepID=UPI0032EFD098|tara:strand:+ start:63 stop:452 length:390 start_codon:yes stop_codon:yes gene_type:complete